MPDTTLYEEPQREWVFHEGNWCLVTSITPSNLRRYPIPQPLHREEPNTASHQLDQLMNAAIARDQLLWSEAQREARELERYSNSLRQESIRQESINALQTMRLTDYIFDDLEQPMLKSKIELSSLDPNRFVGKAKILRAFRALPKTLGDTVLTTRHDKWQRVESAFKSFSIKAAEAWVFRKNKTKLHDQFLRITKKWFKRDDLVYSCNPNDFSLANKIAIREDCEEVWVDDKPESYWILKTEFATHKNSFTWDEFQSLWVWSSAVSVYRTFNKDGKLLNKKFGIVKDWNKYIQICYKCNTFWEKKNLKEHPLTEQYRCPPCFNQIKINVNDLLESSSGDNYIIKGYHSHHPNWEFQIQRTSKGEKGVPFGIELEIHSKYGNNWTAANKAAEEIAKAQQEHNKDWNNFYFEKDGSLMEGGFEMITHPMTLEFHREFWGVMLPEIRKHAVGWNTYQLTHQWGQYGIHITFARNHWRDYYIARLSKFIDNPNNSWFIRGIAQRDRQYRTDDSSLLAQKHRNLIQRFNFKNKKIHNTKSRNSPINVKPIPSLLSFGLVEIRIFRSTLNTESFFKNIEFLHSFHRWCEESPFRVGALDYVNWLSNSGYAHVNYPNLLGYLSRPKFPCRGTKGIKNPIASYFRHVKGISAPIDVKSATLEDRMKEDLEPCA